MTSFLKFDPFMPRSIRRHFEGIELSIVMEGAWENGSPVVETVKTILSG
jgi:hypothetical protein